MKSIHSVGACTFVTVLVATSWLGCGDDSTAPGNSALDSGAPDSTMAATPDGGADSGQAADSAPVPDSAAAAPDAGTSPPDGGTGASDGAVDASDAGSTAGSDGGADGGAAGPSCSTYCADIIAACGTAAPYAQYQNVAECMVVCSILEGASAAEQGSTSVGTVACRDEHALNALASDASAPGGQGKGLGQNPHCWHAGPYGGSVCGDPCTSFCLLDTTFCSPADGYVAGPPPYASLAACLTKCATYAAVDSMIAGWDNAGGFNAASVSGNTLDCREYHLLNAINPEAGVPPQTEQSIHCPHTASISAVCGDAGP